ncbi:MAG: hypothetical protein P4K83_02670 [Terracidiphilus sp.]|nr:hypothetical protein [Terracidiphilus sp.]
MSTKITIRHESDEATKHAYHLYREELFGDEPNEVYLELDGFHFEASSMPDIALNPVHARPRITVKIPADWARKLGLIE